MTTSIPPVVPLEDPTVATLPPESVTCFPCLWVGTFIGYVSLSLCDYMCVCVCLYVYVMYVYMHVCAPSHHLPSAHLPTIALPFFPLFIYLVVLH